jgi:hypothetical protein
MLRLGETTTEQEAKVLVHALIDRAFHLEQARQKRETAKQPLSSQNTEGLDC